MLAIGKTLTPQQRLSKCVIDILGNEKYTAMNGVVMIGERAVKPCPPFHTACTNGRDEWYDPAFIELLNDAELRFVIIHENFHKMYRNLITWCELYKIDPRLANQACDHVINIQIVDDNKDGFATMPVAVPGHNDERFRNMSAAQVFNILRKEEEGEEGEGEGEGEGEEGEGEPGKGKPCKGKPGSGSGGFDEHDWEGAQELTEAEKNELEREIDEAIRQGALTAGKLGTGGAIDINELVKTQVDWREVLREFIKTTCAGSDYSTYNRPNRRYLSTGVYMPSGISEAVGDLVFAVDMSGSTSMGKMRPMFLAEIQEVCNTVNPARIHVMYWDTKVAKHEVYMPEQMADFRNSTRPAGGGGTTVRCVPEFIKDNNINAQAVVILTDGDLYGQDWGIWTSPTLWCIVDSDRVFSPIGKTIHIDSDLA